MGGICLIFPVNGDIIAVTIQKIRCKRTTATQFETGKGVLGHENIKNFDFVIAYKKGILTEKEYKKEKKQLLKRKD